MNDQPVTDALLRRFLLGQVNDEERQRIEILFMTDPVSKERILGMEQDLIEDYLEDSLKTDDKKSFLLQYSQTSEQQRKFRIMQSVKDLAVREANGSRINSAAPSIWQRLFAGLKLRPVFVIPIAVTSIIAIAIAAFWLSRRTEPENREYLARQQELVQLNDPSRLREVLPDTTKFELTPISVRSVEPRAELTIQSNSRNVELHLAWIQKETFPSYRASIQRVGDSATYKVDNLHGEGDGGNTIRLRLPAFLQVRGTYKIELSGIDTRGAVGSAEEYAFTIGG